MNKSCNKKFINKRGYIKIKISTKVKQLRERDAVMVLTEIIMMEDGRLL